MNKVFQNIWWEKNMCTIIISKQITPNNIITFFIFIGYIVHLAVKQNRKGRSEVHIVNVYWHFYIHHAAKSSYKSVLGTSCHSNFTMCICKSSGTYRPYYRSRRLDSCKIIPGKTKYSLLNNEKYYINKSSYQDI